MPAPLIIKIDVKKLNKDWFFRSDKGAVYADLVLYYNDEPDAYGNHCAIKQNPSRAAKEADPSAKGHYVGNAKLMPQRGGAEPQPQTRPSQGGYRKANVPPPAAQGGDEWSDESTPF